MGLQDSLPECHFGVTTTSRSVLCIFPPTRSKRLWCPFQAGAVDSGGDWYTHLCLEDGGVTRVQNRLRSPGDNGT